jgi:hypothetical protein
MLFREVRRRDPLPRGKKINYACLKPKCEGNYLSVRDIKYFSFSMVTSKDKKKKNCMEDGKFSESDRFEMRYTAAGTLTNLREVGFSKTNRTRLPLYLIQELTFFIASTMMNLPRSFKDVSPFNLRHKFITEY